MYDLAGAQVLVTPHYQPVGLVAPVRLGEVLAGQTAGHEQGPAEDKQTHPAGRHLHPHRRPVQAERVQGRLLRPREKEGDSE